MAMLLHIDASPRAESVSSRLAAGFVDRWMRRNAHGTVVHRNTSREKIEYLDEAMVRAFLNPGAEASGSQRAALAYSDKLVDELLAADVLVIGAPMWNLGIPASLKAWIDMIVREGRTFAFAEQGVRPLLKPGKRVLVFSARGGAYGKGTGFEGLDYFEPYLRAILGSIGLKRIEFVYAENQSGGPKTAAEGIVRAMRAVDELQV